ALGTRGGAADLPGRGRRRSRGPAAGRSVHPAETTDRAFSGASPHTSHAALVASPSHPGRDGGGFLSAIVAHPAARRGTSRMRRRPRHFHGPPPHRCGPQTAPSPKLLFFPCLSSSPVAPPGPRSSSSPCRCFLA